MGVAAFMAGMCDRDKLSSLELGSKQWKRRNPDPTVPFRVTPND